MATKGLVARAVSALRGDKAPVEPHKHPDVLAADRVIADSDTRLAEETRRLEQDEAALAAARATLRAERLKQAEGASADVESARRSTAAAEDAVEGRRDLVEALRAKLASAHEERRRACVEVAEPAAIEAAHAEIREVIADVRAHVEGLGTPKRSLLADMEELDRLHGVVAAISPWGSPQASRHGWNARLGEAANVLLAGRHSAVPTLLGTFLTAPSGGRPSAYAEWLGVARDAGLLEE